MFHKKKNLIVGRNPLIEALESGINVDKILLYKNASGDVIQQIRQLAKDKNVPIQMVPNEKLNALTNIQHQGVLAFKAAVVYQDLQAIIDWVSAKGELPFFIMLDGVTDVRNIGAIARTAVCCGAHAIIIPDKGVGALNEDAVKSSAGALEQIQICRVNSLMKAIDELHLNGIKVFASEMNASNSIFEIDFKEPCTLVLGGEEKGVFKGIQRIADVCFKIPMAGKFESLNVSVAGGMMMYEVMKQRMLA